MQTYRADGIILKRIESGEADRIMWILTPTHGMVKAIAKAARKPRSKLGGFLDLFARIEATFAPGRTFDVVTEARTIDSFGNLRTNVQHHVYAGHVAELVTKALHEGGSEHEQLFTLVLETFRCLNSDTVAPHILTAFRFKFLTALGYALNTAECASCHMQLVKGPSFLTESFDGILCPSCAAAHKDFGMPAARLTPDTLHFLRILATTGYGALSKIIVPSTAEREAERLSVLAVQYHLSISCKSDALIHASVRTFRVKTVHHAPSP